jgi:alkylation response protein AidB-like acyl-CoA dehydrogenase
MATPALARYGSDFLKDNFLKPAVAGELVAAIGVSEPGAGSDVAGIKTTAVREGGDYVINGQKMWITNGTQADWVCLLCNTGAVEGGGRHGNKSLIVVPLDAKGVNRTTKLDKLGQRASDTAIIFFDNVRVPASHLIGQEGRGFIYQMEQFQEERLFLAASIVAAMDNCVSETATYTRQRKAFGQSILDNQYVQFRLAELKTEIEADLPRHREHAGRRRRDPARQHGQAQGRPPGSRSPRRLPAVLGRPGLHVGQLRQPDVPRPAPARHRRRRRRDHARHHQQAPGFWRQVQGLRRKAIDAPHGFP